MTINSIDLPRLLEKAIALAVKAHRGQIDKAGQPYILHPIRVMSAMDSVEEKMAAVLHDVIEDSPMNLDGLRLEGFPEAVVAAVDSLTRRPGETYTDFIARACLNPIARRVKRADLLDNLDVTRIDRLTDRDLNRMAKYHRALRQLDNFPAANAIGDKMQN